MGNNLQTINQDKESVFSNKVGFDNAMEIAKTLSSSELVPAAYKGKPQNCIIALDVARQVNNSPLVVMQNLHIIQGKPSWSSTYIAATIRSRYKNIKIQQQGTGMDRQCRVVAYDDDGNIIAEGATVTMKMAAAEGWLEKSGSKWKTMPELMMQYRANAFFGRVYCPDALIGLKSEYENEDISRPINVKADVSNPFDTEKKTDTIEVNAEVTEDLDEQLRKELKELHPTEEDWQIQVRIDERKENAS